MRDLTIFDDSDSAPLDRVNLSSSVSHYLEQSLSKNTLRAYASDWAQFMDWCEQMEVAFLPAAPGTVAYFIVYLADHRKNKVSTIDRKLAAIRHYHAVNGFQSPTDTTGIELTMRGVRRQHGTAQTGKAAATVDTLRKLVAVCDMSLAGLRDRALLLVGYAGAFRRSALVALEMRDLTFQAEGLRVLIRKDKTDQEQRGRTIGIAYGSHYETCPVRSLRAWLDAAGITEGPVFRTFTGHGSVRKNPLDGGDVARIVKRRCEEAGLDPEAYAGHSLRAGFATQAAMNGVQERTIAKQTGHKSMEVLRRYIREGELFRDNASTEVGL